MPKVGGRRVPIHLLIEKTKKSQIDRSIARTWPTKNIHIQERKKLIRGQGSYARSKKMFLSQYCNEITRFKQTVNKQLS